MTGHVHPVVRRSWFMRDPLPLLVANEHDRGVRGSGRGVVQGRVQGRCARSSGTAAECPVPLLEEDSASGSLFRP